MSGALVTVGRSLTWAGTARVEKKYPLVIVALRGHLDPSSRALAGQDFCHISQGEE